jgi:hypothetical protein
VARDLADIILAYEARCKFVRKHNPDNYGRYVLLCWLEIPLILFFSFLFIWAIISWLFFDYGVASVLEICVIILISRVFSHAKSRIDKAAEAQAEFEERSKNLAIKSIAVGTERSAETLTELTRTMAKVTTDVERLARVRGDTIIQGNITVSGEGVVIIGSELVNSMNRNPEIADALKVVAGFVQEAGNPEAAKCLNELIKRNNQGEDKVVTSALWDRLIKILPSISSLTDAFITLTKFFISAG